MNVTTEAVRPTMLDYRIESEFQIYGPLLSRGQVTQVLMGDRALAIVAAAKSCTVPNGREIRVVHVPTGEVVFTKVAGAEALEYEVATAG